jgi:phosphatidate cytidylyltransferase
MSFFESLKRMCNPNLRLRVLSALMIILIVTGLIFFPEPFLLKIFFIFIALALQIEWIQLVFIPSENRTWISRWIAYPLGTIYIFFALKAVWFMNCVELSKKSPQILPNIFIGLCIADTMAFLGGSLLGEKKMCPSISPNKTWMGFFFGIISCTLFFSAVTYYNPAWGIFPSVIKSAAAGLILGLLGVVGDLLESFIKRIYDVKDSGNIIPGHGGVWDLLDSVIFVLVVIFLIFIWKQHHFNLIKISYL